MGLFSSNVKFEEMNDKIENSFSNVKRDTQILFAWINYLQYQNQFYLNELKDIKHELKFVPKQEEIKQLVDMHYNQIQNQIGHHKIDSGLRDEVEELKQTVVDIASSQKNVFEKLEALSERGTMPEKPRSNFKERLIKKIAKSSKDYVKTVMLSLIKKYGQLSALKLREIVIDEQGLSSKSSFYRILEEIEHSGEVNTVQKGKNKVLLYKVSKKVIEY
jgi:hypothetical protein